MPVIYSARWVLPISSPPIQEGAIAIEGSRILAVGPRKQVIAAFSDARVHDFNQAAILPGLINAHSHLELTVMRGFLEKDETDFFAWLRKLTGARLEMTPQDLFVSATCGAIEAVCAGITCTGDSSSAASQSMLALREVGLRGIVYQESFGPDPGLAGQNVANLREQLNEMATLETNLVRAGVSPHAPYTVSAPQLEMIARIAIDEKLPLMMHAAESKAEQSFVTEGTGPFAEGLKKRGIEWRAPGISSISYLSNHGILDAQPLLAHCINVDASDLERIKTNGAGIVHCPKSNSKLRHGRAPFAEFLRHGINTGLGSDSVASNNNCDLLEEARFATLTARTGGDAISPEQALFAATLGGAKAIRMDDEIGALKEGLQADLVVVNLAGSHQQPPSDPADSLIFSSSGRDVLLTVIAGREIYRQGLVTTADENDFLAKNREIRSRFENAT